MEKKHQDYFDFIKSMLNDKTNLPTDTKMTMIKQQTKSLIIQELNDYDNNVTNQHNEYIEKLNAKLL